MKALINSVRLMGRLGMDPEIKFLENNRKLARMSLATNDVHKTADGEKITDTQWHNLVVWGQNAAIAEKYLKKGKEIAVEGRLVTRSFMDKGGQKHFVTEVVVNELLMISKKEQAENELVAETV